MAPSTWRRHAALVARVSATVAGVALISLLAANLAGVRQAPAPAAAPVAPEPVADYGVCRGVSPSCYHTWDTAFRRDPVRRILIYSRTGSSRHAHLGALLGPGLNPPLGADNVAQRALVQWATDAGLQADWTEDVTQLATPAQLLRYDGVVFLSTSRDILDDAAQTSLTQYMRAGGGFVAIHNTLGTEYNWPYFQGLLGGANFYDHGAHRDGVVVTVDSADASTKGLPANWPTKDEFYNLVPFPSKVRELLALKPGSAGDGLGFNGHPGHPRNHPLSWCQYYDGGRSWVTSLGHDVNDWGDGPLPGKEFFKAHVMGGILSAIGAAPFCQ
jgi:type 1 glutamine amidotransferase